MTGNLDAEGLLDSYVRHLSHLSGSRFDKRIYGELDASWGS